jgi:hypothetical protein
MEVCGIASLDDLGTPVAVLARDFDRDGLLLCKEKALAKESREHIKHPVHTVGPRGRCDGHRQRRGSF